MAGLIWSRAAGLIWSRAAGDVAWSRAAGDVAWSRAAGDVAWLPGGVVAVPPGPAPLGEVRQVPCGEVQRRPVVRRHLRVGRPRVGPAVAAVSEGELA